MPIPRGAADWTHAKREGRFIDSLITDHSWVARRVDTLSFLDGERLERRVTLDLDLSELRRRAKTNRLRSDLVPLPLLTLVKAPLLDVDVKDVHGNSLAIATSDQDSHLASAMLLATLARHGVRVRTLPDSVLKEINAIAGSGGDSRLEEVLYAASPESFQSAPAPSSSASITLSPGDKRTWNELLDVDEFLNGLFDFASSFMLISQINLEQQNDVAIIKIRLLEGRDTEDTRSTLFSPDRLGWKPQVQRIPMGGLGRAQRNHVRVLAPADSTVRSAKWSLNDDQLHRVHDGVEDGKQAHLDRASFYRSALEPGDYEATIELEPSRGPFLVPAALTIGLLAFLLGAATYLQGTDARFSAAPERFLAWPGPGPGWEVQAIQAVQANFDAAVTVLAIVPSLIAIYIVRAGEHQLVTRLMTIPRLLVLASAFAAIVCAGATAASVQPDFLHNVYICATAISVLALVFVLIPIARVTAFRSRRSRSR